jgi:hypothetical protein
VATEEKEVFFFEKKNQKTFSRWHARPILNGMTNAHGQKFFASFFKE